TLTEVLVSIALLAICLTGILPMFFAAKVSMDEAHDKRVANFIVERYFDELRDLQWEQVGSTGLQNGTDTMAVQNGEWYFRRRVNTFYEHIVGNNTGADVDAWSQENATFSSLPPGVNP